MSESALTQPQRTIGVAVQGLPPGISTPDYVSLYNNQPERWEYDTNPASNNSRATYLGEVYVGGTSINDAVATIGDIAEATTGVATWNTRTGNVVMTLADVTGVGGAPINNTALQGVPTAATAALGTTSTQLATCAFVTNAISNNPGVYSWNGRQGAVTLTLSDVTGVGGAPISNPMFLGVPQGPTATLGTNTQQLATCAYVMNAIGGSVVTWNGRVGNVTLTLSDVTSVGGAPINAPAFTGVATAVTASPGTATQQLATCAFVSNAVQAATVGVSSFNTRTGAVVLGAADISAAGGALLAGPALTGVPTCPTAPASTNTNQIASCAFVESAIAGAGVVSSFNGRVGAVALTSGDVGAAGALMETGGTMSGNLLLAGNAASALAAVPYQQLESVAAGYLPLTGGTLTGALTLSGNAAANLNPVSLQQLQAGYLPLSGGTLTGNLSAPQFSLPLSGSSGGFPIGGLLMNAAPNASGGYNAIVAGPGTSLGLASNGTAILNVYPPVAAGAAFGNPGAFAFEASGGTFICGIVSAGAATFTNGTIGGVIFNGGQNLWPTSTNVSSCGVVSQAWNTCAAYNFPNPSDPRLKKNIAARPPGALACINAVPVHEYNWNQETDTDPLHAGWMANEVQAAFPGSAIVVTGTDEAKTLAVSTNEMLAVLWQAVQELSAELTALKTQLGGA